MPVDVLPEFTPPTVEIQTEALGLSAAEVEQLVTVPLEQDLLNGVAWLAEIRSNSVPGLSSIDLIFQPGTDVLRARQMVQERLTQAHALPHVSKPPVMIQPVSSTSRVAMVSLSSSDMSLIDMSVLARWRIKPRLMGVPGVANVSIWGQRERQLQVLVDPDRLAQSGVTLNQVIRTTGNALWVSPLTFVEASTPGTGGFIDTPNQRLSIQHILPIRTPADLAQVSIEDTEAKPMRLGDVAQVVEDHQPLIGDAVVNDRPGLMIVVEKLPGANTVQVTRDVEAALDALRPGLSGMKFDSTVFRPATFIESATDNLAARLLLALLLVAVLLGAFFLDWRTGVISLVTIPLALVTAGYVLYLRGNTLNTLVLAGLVIGLAAVIDDAIVGVDHVKRRLREARAAADPAAEPAAGPDRSSAAVILDATLEIRGPLVFATLILIVAALPVFFLGGVVGAFARPLAISYVLAVVAALAVALVVTPALAIALFTGGSLDRRESVVARTLRRGYSAAISRVIGWWGPALVAVVALIALGLLLVPQLGGRPVLPALQDRDLLIQWTSAPGVSQPEMVRITGLASAELRAVPGVRGVGAHVGRAISADQVVGVNSGELWVSVDPKADYTATAERIRDVVDGYPGLLHSVQTYPDQRVREVLTGTGNDIVVRVFGDDLDVLRAKAEEVRQLLARTNGVVDPRVDLLPEEPTVEIEVNLAAAEQYGIKPGDVRRATATLLSGLLVGNLFEDQKVFDVVVWGVPSARSSLTSIREAFIDTPKGGRVRLKDVADVRLRPNLSVIKHDAVSRRIDITANVRGRSVPAVSGDIRTGLKKISFPLEHHAELLGDKAERSGVQSGLLTGVAAGTAVVILLLLQAAFGSWRLAALLFVALPVSLVGGLVAALAGGAGITLGCLVALLAVWGLATRNGVLLVRHYQHLERDEGMAPGSALVIRGARERAVPVLATALTLAVALVPLAAAGNVAGVELLRPLAVVALGGLVTSTLLTLFILPALYLRFGSGGRREPAVDRPRPEGEQTMVRLSRGQRWTAGIIGVVVVAATAAVVIGVANASSTAATDAPAAEQPAKVEPIAGSAVKRVTLSAAAAKRLGIQTAPARQTPVAGTPRLVIPYAAVLYDPSGDAWTYTSPAPLTFVRQRITVDSIQGDQAVLTDGPSADTLVVTVGSPELYGTEVGVGGDE